MFILRQSLTIEDKLTRNSETPSLRLPDTRTVVKGYIIQNIEFWNKTLAVKPNGCTSWISTKPV